MVAVEFSSEATDTLLRSNNTPASPDAYDLMLTAFGVALADWSGGRTFRLDVEGHGREAIGEEIEVSRTIGWFMTMYPIILDMSQSDSLSAAVEQTRQMLRSIPNKGMNYGILKYLTKHESARRTAILERKANINFNYMGQFGNELNNEKFTFSAMPPGDTIGLDNERMYQLEAVAMIVGGQLVVRFVYNTRDYEYSNIQELVNRYKTRLEALLELHKHGYASVQRPGLNI
ncbi:condensation domain-containing protein [Paenibacillus sp. E194]|uniref:condensation domain-containing protein n=1 Tax=Paenibacillus sp. E194 TaxID=1458845 RepID=UPI0018CD04C8|nr:condensation domain-containing protein [Paenibacillus sp. E194]